MDDVKSALASKTVWCAVVAGIAPILGLIGISLTDADQTVIVDSIVAVVTAAGSVLAIYARVTATTRIGGFMKADAAMAPSPPPPVAPSIIRP